MTRHSTTHPLTHPPKETTMPEYRCWIDEDHTRIDIDADTALDAAQEYVDGGDWGDAETTDGASESTRWISVYVEDEDGDVRSHQIALEPAEPTCADGEAHDWRAPLAVVGGIAENPGVWGHGGGVKMREVCAHCGTYRLTDTWATDYATGEQGLHSVRYEDADDDARAWLERRRANAR